MKKLFTLDHLFFISIITSIVILIIPLFSTTIRASGDGFAHKFREASFIKSLHEGNIRPRWLADQAIGYGTPTLMYNFSIPYYAVAGIHAFVGSIEKSSQIYAAIIILATFGSMYLFVQKLYGIKIGLLTALAYIGTPTFIYCIYGLEGWGQMTAFIFPPFILYIALLLKEKVTAKRAVLFVLAWILFINTHNVSALLSVLPIACILSILMGNSRYTLKFMAQLFFASGIISAFFWLPAITLSSWIKYNDLVLYHANIRQYDFSSIQHYITLSVQTVMTGITSIFSDTPGLFILTTIIVSLILFLTILFQKIVHHKHNTDPSVFYAGALFLFSLVSLMMTIDVSLPLWKTGLFNFVILYPSRFLFVLTFTGTLLFGWVIRKITNTWILLILSILILVCARPFTNPVFKFDFDNHYFENSLQLIDWASGSRMSMGTVEFLPKWMDVDFVRRQQNTYFETNKLPEKIEVNPQDGTVLDQRILSERMLFHVKMERDADVVINTSYYPNWKAEINSNPVPVSMDTFGRILIHIPKGKGSVSLYFGYTVIERWGYVLSIAGLIFLIYILVRYPGENNKVH